MAEGDGGSAAAKGEAGGTLAPRSAETAAVREEEVEALRERAERAERENVLRRALNGIDWFDSEDAYRELSQHAERNERGEWEVAVAESGVRERVRVAPDEAARRLAKAKPHWVRARVIGGSGSNGGGGESASGAALTYADLLKPENAARLSEYLHNRPRELERLRQAHYSK